MSLVSVDFAVGWELRSVSHANTSLWYSPRRNRPYARSLEEVIVSGVSIELAMCVFKNRLTIEIFMISRFIKR